MLHERVLRAHARTRVVATVSRCSTGLHAALWIHVTCCRHHSHHLAAQQATLLRAHVSTGAGGSPATQQGGERMQVMQRDTMPPHTRDK